LAAIGRRCYHRRGGDPLWRGRECGFAFGQVAERLNAPVSKTGLPLVGNVGSNPTLSAFFFRVSGGPAGLPADA
jgi:hypothetical protein